MKWSPQQEAAILAVHRHLQSGDRRPFILQGYAGTGKTTLARELVSGLTGNVHFCTFTGKAAHVLRTKGCQGATTIHSLIYKPTEKSKERLEHLREDLAELKAEIMSEMKMEWGGDLPEDSEARIATHHMVRKLQQAIDDEVRGLKRPAFMLNIDSIVKHAQLIVVDEYSMVDEFIGQDLESFNKPILLLGDPAQLPPVRGKGWLADREPDILLTEIHRQAWDNPIIEMATKVRTGKSLEMGNHGTSSVIDIRDGDPSMYSSHDQVLCGRENRPKNGDAVWRANINRRMRSLLGLEDPMPQPGEKVVCLKNNHEEGLLNGEQWKVLQSEQYGDTVGLSLEGEENRRVEVLAHSRQFTGEEIPYWELKNAELFDFGYCMTVHKSQGSQWDSILLFNQSRIFREDARKWLYTGITRAAEKVTVVEC